jgi:hypothetical protein
LGETNEALDHIAEAIRIARFVASERPRQPGLRHNLIAPLTRLGELHLDAKIPSPRRPHWRKQWR